MKKDEYLDVLSERGEHTGTKKLRADVHKDGDYHRAVHAWIINSKGELLLQRRGPTKETHPNMLDISVAGHIEAGQTSLETVRKEAQEELGLELLPDEIEFLFTYYREVFLKNNTFINRSFHDIYLIQKDVLIEKLTLDPREVSEIIYMPWRKVKEEIAEENPEFLQHPDEFPRLFETLKERLG